ncbi:unnamed protein product [Didymodactylos carnosus]|uniref:Uncharacterized protein n=1 Tax=Didymodactylos carnosus TaxID=1234261 RepID=A0A816CCZ5_9BILA|nr:unnamed protein product [Didymodactylos carnosus]CAF4514760.1 unnamed protein product [Didymodactylos carnosus]
MRLLFSRIKAQRQKQLQKVVECDEEDEDELKDDQAVEKVFEKRQLKNTKQLCNPKHSKPPKRFGFSTPQLDKKKRSSSSSKTKNKRTKIR